MNDAIKRYMTAVQRFFAGKNTPYEVYTTLWRDVWQTSNDAVTLERTLLPGSVLAAFEQKVGETRTTVEMIDSAVAQNDRETVDREIGRFQDQMSELLAFYNVSN